MPTYVYRCKKCKHRFELFHSISDESVKRCPRCGSKAERIPAAGAGILFKGSGFYITDYRSQSYKDRAKQEKSGSATSSDSGATPGTPTGSSGESATRDEKRPAKGASRPEGSRRRSRSRPGGPASSSSGGD